MTKKLLVIALIITLVCGGLAMAGNPSDSFTMTLTPTGWRGVIIDTAAIVGTLSLGDVAVGGSTETASGIPCITTGTVANIEYKISASVSGGATIDDNGVLLSTEIGLEAEFKDSGPTYGDLVDGTPEHVNNGSFCANGDMDSMALGYSKNLWCKITLPATVSYSGKQSVTVTLTAQDGVLD